jgi:hypothetical protein
LVVAEGERENTKVVDGDSTRTLIDIFAKARGVRDDCVDRKLN